MNDQIQDQDIELVEDTILARISAFVRGYSAMALVLLGLSLVVIVGLLDYLTGTRIAFFAVYLIPVCFVSWYAGKWPGLAVSFVAALVTSVADVMNYRKLPYPAELFWNAASLFVVYVLVAHVLSELARARRYETRLARIDHLTGILNGRGFIERASAELERASRYERPLSLAYIDIDGFDRMNVSNGWDNGDIVLRMLADTIRASVRISDTIGRVGGDEFAVLLAESDSEAAQQAVAKIQNSLIDLAAARKWPLTFSVGVLTCLTVPDSPRDLLKQAERLMLGAKTAGGNAVRHDVFAEIASIP